MRRYSKSAASTDSHPLDAIEQSREEGDAVYAHVGRHHGAFLFDPGAFDDSPRVRPSHRFPLAKPHAEPDSIVVVPLDMRAIADGLAQKFDTGLNPPAVTHEGWRPSSGSRRSG